MWSAARVVLVGAVVYLDALDGCADDGVLREGSNGSSHMRPGWSDATYVGTVG